MEGFTVHCPLGDCHGAVKLRSGVGIYYVQAYTERPMSPVGHREPEPAASVGGEQFVDERRRRQLTVRCTDDHFLRVHVAPASTLDTSACLYGPVERSGVRCPECAYSFGTRTEFRLTGRGPTDRTYALTTVTATPPQSYTDVSDLSRAAVGRQNKFAHRRGCPNCGLLLSFNYDSR